MRKMLLASATLIFFSLSIILFQVSCKKEATAQTGTSSSTNCIGERPIFKFKANNVLYDCSASFDSRVGWYGNTYPSQVSNIIEGEVPTISKDLGSSGYYFTGGNQNGYIGFEDISTSAPVVGTISKVNSRADCYIPPFASFTRATYTITFTRVSNGTADGTFTGTLINSSNPSITCPVTEGVFTNLWVLQ